MFVITLIADPQKERLTETLADSIAHALSMQGVAIGKREWLKKDTALDVFTQHSALSTLDSLVQDAIRGTAFDAIVQPVARRKKKLLIADMESTIITCECLDELAEMAGIKDRVAAITRAAMNGEIDFEAALRERVLLLKGMTESALQKVMDEKVRLMPGARELVTTMKKNGAYCMIVSGGFDFFAERVKEMVGFDEYRANRLELLPPLAGGARGGNSPTGNPASELARISSSPASGGGKILTGNVIPPVLGKEAKLTALKDACAKLHISTEEALAVGDGANDLPMLLAAGLGVAYHAKPTVRAQAKARIEHGHLTALLYAQGIMSS